MTFSSLHFGITIRQEPGVAGSRSFRSLPVLGLRPRVAGRTQISDSLPASLPNCKGRLKFVNASPALMSTPVWGYTN